MKNNKRTSYIIVAILLLVVGISIGYAALTATLTINGNTTIKGNTWDVHFEWFRTTSGSVAGTGAIDSNDPTTVNYTVTLQKPGDFYEFTVSAVNKGSIDAMINSVSNTGLTAEQQKYLTYKVEYATNYYNDPTKTISQYHKLPAISNYQYYYTTIKVRVEFRKDLANADLPSTNQQVSLTFTANYVQADGNAITGNVGWADILD